MSFQIVVVSARKCRPFWVSVLDLNQNNAFSNTLDVVQPNIIVPLVFNYNVYGNEDIVMSSYKLK